MSPIFKKSPTNKEGERFVPNSSIIQKAQTVYFTPNIKYNFELFTSILQKDADFLSKKFKVFGETPAVLICLKSLVDMEKIERDIIKQLQNKKHPDNSHTPITTYIMEDVLYYTAVETVKNLAAGIESLLAGKALVFIEGIEQAMALDVYTQEKRSIEQSETERVVRGPRDGFIESLQTNVALLRYRLPVPEFRVEQREVGTRTKTKIAICYLDDIVNPELLEEVRSRIDKIVIDRILDAGYIEHYIQDDVTSPFPQVQNSERPDRVVGNLLEGRVSILVDGSPFALIVPAIFVQFYQTSEDYNERWIITSAIRIIRLAALVFSLTFSSFYVTVLSFHPELIPATFVVAASSGRQGVPFPVVIEVLIMEIAMEILREATVRMPQQVGGALSIVGVLVVGQAAVQAGFVSPITVVIMALSTIGSFATPSYNVATAFRVLRFILIILAGTFGLLGLAVGIMLVLNHMLSLRSFGVPYMAPFSPGNYQELKDSFMRFPIQWTKERPKHLQPQDKKRVDNRKYNKRSGGEGNNET
ncbi:spore germination protein [Lysinibacillus odysseyi]|uniref:spore germination protein n=1 Tax=Lysinibacillus odysseyi TaxID=202611 RepID=UPI00068DBCC1|nr:spore germination protein [Lysinibacillus odysseyi]